MKGGGNWARLEKRMKKQLKKVINICSWGQSDGHEASGVMTNKGEGIESAKQMKKDEREALSYR